MSFISGNDNYAQWIALTFYCVNILYSFIRTKDSKAFKKATYWARVILCTAAIATYYIVRATKFPNGNDEATIIYFIFSIFMFFFGSDF